MFIQTNTSLFQFKKEYIYRVQMVNHLTTGESVLFISTQLPDGGFPGDVHSSYTTFTFTNEELAKEIYEKIIDSLKGDNNERDWFITGDVTVDVSYSEVHWQIRDIVRNNRMFLENKRLELESTRQQDVIAKIPETTDDKQPPAPVESKSKSKTTQK